MAANLKSRGIANWGKRLICNQLIWTSHSSCSSVLSPAALTLKSIRALHTSFYQKNIDYDLAHHAVLPDEVIQPQSDKYWAPHPQTGVFGPAAAQPGTATATAGSHSALAAVASNAGDSDNTDSVLEHEAWFRTRPLYLKFSLMTSEKFLLI